VSVREELGISESEYQDLNEASEGLCWICARPEQVEGRRLALDHDHRTGALRGLLCTSCNRRLGAATNAEWFRRAAEYLDVAARAFGDACRTCRKSAPSMLSETKEQSSTFIHECCGRSWRVGYRTRGWPGSWKIDGAPVPPVRHEVVATDPAVGHPGTTNGGAL
jgi:hypothetical protein